MFVKSPMFLGDVKVNVLSMIWGLGGPVAAELLFNRSMPTAATFSLISSAILALSCFSENVLTSFFLTFSM
jgi:hypothetical protein